MVQQLITPSHVIDTHSGHMGAMNHAAHNQPMNRSLTSSPVLMARHRSWVLGLPHRCEAPPSSMSSPLIIAVGGGKGGVGKSMIAANLSAKFARLGFRVAALDMDCGGSNLHTYFGLSGLHHCLGQYVVQGRGSLKDLLVSTPIEGLTVAASQRDDAWGVADALQGSGMTRLWNGIQCLTRSESSDEGYDIVVLDLGAGSARHTIDLFSCAHVGIIAGLPEPTSVENSYLFLRTALLKLLENAGHRLGLDSQLDEILQFLSQDHPGSPMRSYTDKLRSLYQSNPSMIGSLASVLSGRLMGIVINQTRSQADADIGKAMEMAAQRYFGFTAQFLGHLNYDEAAWKALRNKRLLSQDFPQALVTRRLSEVTTALLKSVGVSVL